MLNDLEVGSRLVQVTRRCVRIGLVVGFGTVLTHWSVAGASQEPPAVVGDSTVTLTKTVPATTTFSSTRPLQVRIAGSTDITMSCANPLAAGICGAVGPVVSVDVLASASATGKATLVAVDPTTGNSDQVTLIVKSAADPTQPKKLTVAVEGCADWYDTSWFDCPDHPTQISRLEQELKPPDGTATVDGGAGAGTLTVTSKAGARSTATVKQLEGFGESTGTLGAADTATEVTVRRRAPIRFGLVIVFFGAAFAALVGWFTEWARRKSDGDVAKEKYEKARADVVARRDTSVKRLKESELAAFAAAWSLEEPTAKPADLTEAEAETPTLVDTYVGEAKKASQRWDQLDQLVAAYSAVQSVQKDAPLALWIRQEIAAADEEKLDADVRLAGLVVRRLHDWSSEPTQLHALLEAAGKAAIETAAAGGVVKRDLGAGPVAGVGTLGGTVDLVGAAPDHDRHHGLTILVLAAAVIAAVALVVYLVGWATPTTRAAVLYAVAIISVVVAIPVAWKKKKLPILVAAAIGWALAAAFAAGDALDPNKGWGSNGDILKTIGASFVVAGTAQLLRFGFPKAAKTDAA